MCYWMLNFNSNWYTILMRSMRCNFTSIIKTNFLNKIIWRWALNYTNNFANTWLQVDNKQICDHLVDVSIKTMKYINDPHGGCIGPQISPCIHSENEIDSFLLFLVMVLISIFLCERIVHENSLVSRSLLIIFFNSWVDIHISFQLFFASWYIKDDQTDHAKQEIHIYL